MRSRNGLELELQFQELQGELGVETAERLLARLKGESLLTPVQQNSLDVLFQSAREEGNIEIERFADELKGIRGLGISDSPIAKEVLAAKGTLERGLRGGRAAAELDIGQAETQTTQAINQFQNQLRSQAALNRLALSGQQPTSLGISNVLAQQRIAQPSERIHKSTSFLDILSGAGSAAQGAAEIGLLFI